MIKEINQARKKINAFYTVDGLDKREIDDIKSILAKASSYVSELEEKNKELREFIGGNIA